MDKEINKWKKYYYNKVTNFPLDTESIWNIEFKMRDIFEENGYGLINYCNYKLYIDDKHMGYYNSIKGDKELIKLLYYQIKDWGYDCYYRRNSQTPSIAYIIFPKNVVCEIDKDLNKLKNRKDVDIDEFLF